MTNKAGQTPKVEPTGKFTAAFWDLDEALHLIALRIHWDKVQSVAHGDRSEFLKEMRRIVSSRLVPHRCPLCGATSPGMFLGSCLDESKRHEFHKTASWIRNAAKVIDKKVLRYDTSEIEADPIKWLCEIIGNCFAAQPSPAPSTPPVNANFMQATGEGVCFAHGPYKNADKSIYCPKWPACNIDPHKPEFVAMAAQSSAPADEAIKLAEAVPSTPEFNEEAEVLVFEKWKRGHLPSGTDIEHQRLKLTWLARARASSPAPTSPSEFDPLWPLYQEYISMVPPKGFIAEEEDRRCELCGKVDECRPYGPHGEDVCFDCAMKDEKAAERQFAKRVLGEYSA
jgi:hypothetical protein